MAERTSGGRLGAERALEIGLRTAHLGAMALLLGAARFEAPATTLRTWLAATALTGAALVASEARHSRHWIVQVRGLLVLAHVGAAGLVQLRAGLPALAAALVIGAVGSHLPRSLRKWSIWHGAVVE